MHNAHTNQVRVDVPLGSLLVAGSGATVSRDAETQGSISLPTAGTSYYVHIPLGANMPYLAGHGGSDPFGFRLDKIVLWYSIGAVDLVTNSISLMSEAIAGAAARAAGTAYGGTLTYDTDDGAATIMGVTQRANLYKTVVSLPTNAYRSADLQLITAEWLLATGASTGTAKVHGVQLRGDFGLYF